MQDKRADWKRLHVGDIVSGYDGTRFGHFQGPIIKYTRRNSVRRNLPPVFLATIPISDEFGEYVLTVNIEILNEAYDESRPLVWTDWKDVPLA